MYEKVIVPLDGSKTAEAILPHVRRLLRHCDAEAILLQAAPVIVLDSGAVVPPEEGLRESRNYLEFVGSDLVRDGARVRQVVEVNAPADLILNTAIDQGASLIAMSTHGRTGIKRFILGSIAEKVARASHIPLLLLRSFPDAPRKVDDPVRTILVPIDESTRSQAILPHAAEFATLHRARILLLHVLEGTDIFLDAPTIEQRLDEPRRILDERKLPWESLVRKGEAASQILDVAESHDIDMIAMTTHGRSGISRWYLGSVMEKVLRASKVPMLVVRGAKPEGAR